jgi:hypothetical protein
MATDPRQSDGRLHLLPQRGHWNLNVATRPIDGVIVQVIFSTLDHESPLTGPVESPAKAKSQPSSGAFLHFAPNI